MLTDSYGGKCPNCAYDRMLVRYGSDGYHHFDACPNCGFNYGEWFDRNEEGKWILKTHCDEWEFWKEQFKFLGLKNKNLLSALLYIEGLPNTKEIESVFDYTNHNW